MKDVKLEKGEFFAEHVMKRISKIMNERSFRISTFEIMGYGHLEITLKLIFHDCSEYYQWTYQSVKGGIVKSRHWYGEDKPQPVADFGKRYQALEDDVDKKNQETA